MYGAKDDVRAINASSIAFIVTRGMSTAATSATNAAASEPKNLGLLDSSSGSIRLHHDLL